MKQNEITKKEFYKVLDDTINENLSVLLTILEKAPKEFKYGAFHYQKAQDILKGIVSTIELINSAELAGEVIPKVTYFKNEMGGVRFSCGNSNLTEKKEVNDIYG